MTGTPFAVRVFPDPDTLSQAAADLVCSLAREVKPGERFTLALSGGSTPRQLYRLLASSPYREAIDWRLVHIFWVDERCVPPHHAESNYKLAFDAFLSRVPVTAENMHRIRGEAGTTAAEAYEKELRQFFASSSFPRFDIVLLGAGKDGHTASLFPGSPAVHEEKQLVLPVRLEPPGLERITLTLPVLNQASHVIFLATGVEKAGVVSEILEQGNRKRYPAGLVRPVHGTLTWMVDQKAAAALIGSGRSCG